MAMDTLEERVEIDHSRYMRSHGKKARGNGMWIFTSKDMGKPNSDEMVTVSGDMSTAAKEAAKKLGVNRIYVMEEVELDEISDRTKTSYLAKAKADQKAAQKRYTKATYRDGGASFFDADTPEMEKDAKRIAKRRKGIAMAKESFELDENVKNVGNAMLKFLATTGTPHGTYSRQEIKDEHNRRMKLDSIYRKTKALYSKESVELDEKLASHIIRGDTYIGVPDRIVAQAKDKVNKMKPSTASEHSKAMQKALSDMGWELTISGKYVREETDLTEEKKDHFVYQRDVDKTKEVVHRGTEQSSKDWIEKNSKFYGHKGKNFDIYKGKYPNVKPSDKLNYSYVAEETNLTEMRTPFIVIDTADDNKVVAMASDEQGAKRSIASSERPPMSIKDKSTLKIVKSRKKQYIGYPLKEETEVNEIFGFGKKAQMKRGAVNIATKVMFDQIIKPVLASEFKGAFEGIDIKDDKANNYIVTGYGFIVHLNVADKHLAQVDGKNTHYITGGLARDLENALAKKYNQWKSANKNDIHSKMVTSPTVLTTFGGNMKNKDGNYEQNIEIHFRVLDGGVNSRFESFIAEKFNDDL